MTDKVRVNMHDMSTKATDSRILKNVSDEKMANLEKAHMNQVPLREFDKKEQISWLWIIDEIEIIKS